MTGKQIIESTITLNQSCLSKEQGEHYNFWLSTKEHLITEMKWIHAPLLM